jgi:hypothetical protein
LGGAAWRSAAIREALARPAASPHDAAFCWHASGGLAMKREPQINLPRERSGNAGRRFIISFFIISFFIIISFSIKFVAPIS